MKDFPKNLRFSLNAPLTEHATETIPYGCRHGILSIIRITIWASVCAFTSDDHICKKALAKWKSYYKKMKEGDA